MSLLTFTNGSGEPVNIQVYAKGHDQYGDFRGQAMSRNTYAVEPAKSIEFSDFDLSSEYRDCSVTFEVRVDSVPPRKFDVRRGGTLTYEQES